MNDPFDPTVRVEVGPGPPLKRSLNLPLITLYGLGTTVGGGIYILVGHVVGRAGLYAPISFVLAAALITFTALTFAELGQRFPKSAGEAVYVREGFRRRDLAVAVGCLVVINGLVSSGALASGFVGYFQLLVGIPNWVTIVSVVTLLGLLAIWGIGQAVGVAAVVTGIEIGGLVMIIWVGREAFGNLPDNLPALVPPLEGGAWLGIISGSFLAFYAFIGFEDMVNVAEEVKDVRRTLPIAIILTLSLTSVLYLAIAIVGVLVLPVANIAASDAPLALIYTRQTGEDATLITLISVVAVLNGALIQIIMASRVLYGMGREGWIPGPFGKVNPRTQTPIQATIAVTLCVMGLALFFDVEQLAQVTTLGLSLVAVLVNGALIKLKWGETLPVDGFTVPLWVPVAGLLISAIFAGLVVWDFIAPLTAR
jgi:basic amino acid/polyamine antiporter, APA family